MIQGLIAPSFFDFWFSEVLGARGMAVRLSLFPGGGLRFRDLSSRTGCLYWERFFSLHHYLSPGIEIQLSWSWISATMILAVPKARSLNPLTNPNPKIITPQTVRREVPEG